MVNNCLETGSLPKSWDTSVLKVIPKNEEEAPSFDFLRPLQVPNEDSKICAGMIEHRMSKVSSDVININQTGGVPNRFIQTSTFLIHLLINLEEWGTYGTFGTYGTTVKNPNVTSTCNK